MKFTKRQVLQEGYPQAFLNNLIESPPDIRSVDYEKTHLSWKCPTHGTYAQSIRDHLRNQQCPKCAREQAAINRALKKRESTPKLNKLKEYDPLLYQKYLSGELQNLTTEKHAFTCPKHKCGYQQTIQGFLKYEGCPLCKSENQALRTQKARRKENPFTQDFIEALANSSDKERARQGTILSTERLKFICPTHGEYIQLVSQWLSCGYHCQECGKEKNARTSSAAKRNKNPFTDKFINELTPEFREKALSGELRVRDLAEFVCPIHGVYKQVVYYHLEGCGCQKCSNSGYTSKQEAQIAESLRERGFKVQTSARNLIKSQHGKWYEIDIYLPDYNLGIEVNGLYWHSVEGMSSHENYYKDPKLYHLQKTQAAERAGIQLIHLFEDDIRDNYDLVVDLICSKAEQRGAPTQRQRIFARKCKVITPNPKQRKQFYNDNHIQGDGYGKPLALTFEGEIVAMMSIQEAPVNTRDAGAYVLNRYATKRGFRIIGGFDKLLKAFNITGEIISYADRTVSDGKLYLSDGWEQVEISEPDYKYVYKWKRYHKFNFRKDRFEKSSNLKFEEGLTEDQLAQLNGLLKIFDCGKIKYRKRI